MPDASKPSLEEQMAAMEARERKMDDAADRLRIAAAEVIAALRADPDMVASALNMNSAPEIALVGALQRLEEAFEAEARAAAAEP